MKSGGRVKTYPMRVDEMLWRQVKSKAALEGLTMREVIEELLRMWFNGEVKIRGRKEVV